MWEPEEQWRKKLSGEDCSLCADADTPENDGSYLITELSHSYLRLPKNQHKRGWVILFNKSHKCELYEWNDEERNGFFDNVSSVAKVSASYFHAVKINYAILGNRNPHIHCHIVPRFADHDAGEPLTFEGQKAFLSAAEYEKIILYFRSKLLHR